jgi:hypothetical protein
MSDDLDQQLRRALRPVDPGDEFTRAVMARVAAQKVTDIRRAASRSPFTTTPTRSRFTTRALPWAPAAIAASLLVAIFMTHEHRQQEENIAQGQRAREELLQALRVTSKKLDIAYQVVHNEADAGADAGV